ncbi:MAG: hypothetical protein RR904_07160 [Bacilli bacterium]
MDLNTNGNVNEFLKNLTKEDLIDIIWDLTKNNELLQEKIIYKYSKYDYKEELDKTKKILSSIVEKYAYIDGFIYDKDVCELTEGIRVILEKSKNMSNKLLSIEINFLVLEEVLKSYDYIHDYTFFANGMVSEITQTTMYIGSTIIDDNIREQIFNMILEESKKKIFDEFDDYRVDLLRACDIFIGKKHIADKMKLHIESLIDNQSDNLYIQSRNEKLLEIIYYAIVAFYNEKEVNKFIEDNIKYAFFRHLLILRYLEKRNYKKAIQLSKEGEEKDKGNKALLLRWKKLRYESYKRLNDLEQCIILAKELLLQGEFSYYYKLKSLSTEKNFYDELKIELKNNLSVYNSTYIKLIEEENDLDEILELTENNPWMIEMYAQRLKDKYKDKVIKIYDGFIKNLSKTSSKRDDYKNICLKIKSYKEITGNDKTEDLINYLKDTYKRRPAFLDELNNI